jgi:hypothetical protein
MSVAGTGGFTGADALLALATLQQSNWNEQMSDEMRVAKLQSDMASDLSSIKSHLERANQNATRFPALDEELQAFMEKYGDVPELQEVTHAVGEIATDLHDKLKPIYEQIDANKQDYADRLATWQASGSQGDPPTQATDPVMEEYQQRQVDNWLDMLTNKLDASSTNDQLRMIHIKQLNDNINNNSSMVSGIIESRNNATSSIINNLA